MLPLRSFFQINAEHEGLDDTFGCHHRAVRFEHDDAVRTEYIGQFLRQLAVVDRRGLGKLANLARHRSLHDDWQHWLANHAEQRRPQRLGMRHRIDVRSASVDLGIDMILHRRH